MPCQELEMRYNRAVVSSPATIANFGPGFDSFGLCLESPVDLISIKSGKPGSVQVKVNAKDSIPSDPDKNTASYSASRMAELCGHPDVGFTMSIRKGMRPGSGIGSSAASSVGGALAMASLLGVRDKVLVLEAAAMGEELISGARHFDNVAAALYGGFTAVADLEKRKIIRVKPPVFDIVVVLPEIEVETRKAREILPRQISLADAVHNLSLASGMMHAMTKRDVPEIASYLDDRISVPYRKSLVPGFDSVRDAAMGAGALGMSLGGSGPAMFAIADGNAAEVRTSMTKALKKAAGIGCSSFVTRPGAGAKLESLS
jgi:homoserine kinase